MGGISLALLEKLRALPDAVERIFARRYASVLGMVADDVNLEAEAVAVELRSAGFRVVMRGLP